MSAVEARMEKGMGKRKTWSRFIVQFEDSNILLVLACLAFILIIDHGCVCVGGRGSGVGKKQAS